MVPPESASCSGPETAPAALVPAPASRAPFDPAATRLLDALPSAALLLGDDGRVLLGNARAREVLQRRAEPLEGEPVGQLIAPLPRLLELSRRPRIERAVDVTLPDGRTVELGFSVGEVGAPGAEEGRFVVVFQDITDVARLRDERDRLLKVAAMGSALPTILHELKNPLASITAATEVLIEEVPDGALREHLHAVLSEVRRMKLSLDGVSTMGRTLVAERYAAVDHACREAFAVMSGRARASDIHCHCDIQDMPLLPLDAAMVSGIVHNLMVNAIQACSTGQTINLYARLEDAGRRFVLNVVDNGPGMPAEVYARCTELFFTTKRNGSGIGLALCRRAAEEAGGELTIESVAGFGTSVTLSVPLPRTAGPRR